MKNTLKKLGITSFVFLSFASVVFAASTASGSFSLTRGKVDYGSAANLSADYPYVKYTNQGSTSDAVISATLLKSTLGIYNIKARDDRKAINASVVYSLFSNYGSGTYKTTFVGETGTANAAWLLTSKSHAGTP